MKILFISTKGPLPTNDGHCLRTYNLLCEVARHHEVFLLSFVKFAEEWQHVEKMRKICSYVEYVPVKENISRFQLCVSLFKNLFSDRPFLVQKYDVPEMRKKIRRVLNEEDIDIVHIDMLPLFCYKGMLGKTPIVLNQHNIESALLARRTGSEKRYLNKMFFSMQQKRLELFEKKALRGCNKVAVCSEQDLALASHMEPTADLTVVPNGVDVEFFKPSGRIAEEDDSLVFVGGLNWYPNRDGLEWFDRAVLPLIVAERPNVKVHIIGRKEEVALCHSDKIVMHGFVDDIRPHLEKAAVYIVPLRVGGGTRLKILDALAMEKAVVSTSVGAEGLGCTDGVNIVLRDDAESFAKEICRLLATPKLRYAFKSKGREHVLDNFQWSFVGKKILDAYKSLGKEVF